jgi:hypothetical protein
MTIFYPEQDVDDVKPYPWCIQGMGMHCSVINVTLVNPYKGIDFGSHANELHYISNVFGQPLTIGVYIDKTTDIGRVENVHFNPHAWARAAHPSGQKAAANWGKLQEYIEQHFVGFLIGKTDWEYMRDCFCIFPKIGYHFIETQAGAPNVVLTQCGADICPVAVRVDASQEHAGIAFENGQFMSTVIIGPENKGPVKFTNCGFWATEATDEQVIVDGEGTVMLNACHFADWARVDASAPCIRVKGAALLMQSSDLVQEQKKQVLIERRTKVVVSIVGCRLRGGERIDDQSVEGEIQIGHNVYL